MRRSTRRSGCTKGLEAFQRQAVDERTTLEEGYRALAEVLGMPAPGAEAEAPA